jgi:hypothetical protein
MGNWKTSPSVISALNLRMTRQSSEPFPCSSGQKTYRATLPWITHGAAVVDPSVISPPRKPMRRIAKLASLLDPQYLNDTDIIDDCAASYTATSCIRRCKSATMKLGREESQLVVKIATKGNSSPILTHLQKQEAQKEACSTDCLQPPAANCIRWAPTSANREVDSSPKRNCAQLVLSP